MLLYLVAMMLKFFFKCTVNGLNPILECCVIFIFEISPQSVLRI